MCFCVCLCDCQSYMCTQDGKPELTSGVLHNRPLSSLPSLSLNLRITVLARLVGWQRLAISARGGSGGTVVCCLCPNFTRVRQI